MFMIMEATLARALDTSNLQQLSHAMQTQTGYQMIEGTTTS